MILAAMGWVAAVVASALALALHLRGAHRQRALEAVSRELRERDASARTLLQALLDASPVAFVLLTEVGKIVVENAAARRVFFADRSAEGQNFLRLAANVSQDLQSALARTSDAIVSLHVDGQYETFHFARRTLGYLGAPHTLVMVRPMTSEVAAHDIDVLKRVLLMTAWTSLESAIELMREGAADYFAKPWKDEKLLATIRNLLRVRELSHDNSRLRSRGRRARRALAEQHRLCGLVYASDAMHEAVSLAIALVSQPPDRARPDGRERRHDHRHAAGRDGPHANRRLEHHDGGEDAPLDDLRPDARR